MKQNYRVTVRLEDGKLLPIDGEAQETLLEAMTRQGIFYRADCGGRGTCGKCRIRVTNGNLKPTIQDEKIFSPEELKAGYRLACKAVPEGEATVVLCGVSEQNMKSVAENRLGNDITDKTMINENSGHQVIADQVQTREYIIAIDLGTTTLAFLLSEASSGTVLSTYTHMNPQRAYGADVISRIKASVDGRGDALQAVIQKALLHGIQEVIKQSGVTPKAVTQLAIAGNTTMIHLLLGYSCETLGVYPFLPVKNDTHRLSIGELFTGDGELLQSMKQVPVLILPGVSAFIGGDIVAGLAVSGFHSSENISLLIDLGTNGELALGNRDKLLVASTAAGPAFEGGNISCGTGSIPGAVSHVEIREDNIQYETIASKEPLGICGTGVIELAAELYQNGMIDETGLLCEKYFSLGYPVEYKGKTAFTFLQKDIRELQLAKAAVRAGVEVLLRHYGITYEQVDRVYLAGGFGYYLDMEKAIRIGLLPEEWKDRITAVGNSSLAGAEQSARSREYVTLLEKLAKKAQEVPLSLTPDFNELYLRYMSFQ
jgi:uncharacterized 2Fe-2S/4Fe-4S cluster protein (DUF4445 family)